MRQQRPLCSNRLDGQKTRRRRWRLRSEGWRRLGLLGRHSALRVPVARPPWELIVSGGCGESMRRPLPTCSTPQLCAYSRSAGETRLVCVTCVVSAQSRLSPDTGSPLESSAQQVALCIAAQPRLGRAGPRAGRLYLELLKNASTCDRGETAKRLSCLARLVGSSVQRREEDSFSQFRERGTEHS